MREFNTSAKHHDRILTGHPNGATTATLASLDSVKLAGLSASAVPAIVASKSLGDGIDGLLGMSFLSRFTVVIEDREIQLRAKTLGE